VHGRLHGIADEEGAQAAAAKLAMGRGVHKSLADGVAREVRERIASGGSGLRFFSDGRWTSTSS